jgi:mono/diheme cytochrome c family protein
MRYPGIISIIVVLLLLSSACSSAPSTPSAPPSSSSPPSKVSPTSTTAGGQTFGQLANTGKTVFSNKCSKCHGDNGQGVTAPAIIGSNASLSKYNTAQGLLNFIDTAMPFNAPGSLSSQDYMNLLGFLLVQNDYVTANTAFDPNQLGNIQLKK